MIFISDVGFLFPMLAAVTIHVPLHDVGLVGIGPCVFRPNASALC